MSDVRTIVVLDFTVPGPAAIPLILKAISPPSIPYFTGAARVAVHADAEAVLRWLDDGDDTSEPVGPFSSLSSIPAELRLKRLDQQNVHGYTPEHDDEQGLHHLLEEVRIRLRLDAVGLPDRETILTAAGLLVAALEYLDRNDPFA